ncbi:MAG: IS200/IS605 family transposase [Thermoplasmata archaeon]
MKSKKYSNRKNLSGKVSGIYIVFHTKYNRPLLKGSIQKRTKDIIHDVLDDLDCGVVQIRVYLNRVHLQFIYPPRLSISKIMNNVKGKSSRFLRREFPELVKQCPKALWAPKFGMIY